MGKPIKDESIQYLSKRQIDKVIRQCGLQYRGGGTESWTSPGYRTHLYKEGEQRDIAHIFFKHEVPSDLKSVKRDIFGPKPDDDVLPFHGAIINTGNFVDKVDNYKMFDSEALHEYAKESGMSLVEKYLGDHTLMSRQAIYKKEIGSPSSDNPVPGGPLFNESALRETIKDIIYFNDMIDALDKKISEAKEFKEFSDDGQLSSDELDNIVKAAILAYK